MRSSFEIIDFFDIRAKFFEEYTIFKKNSVKKIGKSIFPNLMSSALFGYPIISASFGRSVPAFEFFYHSSKAFVILLYPAIVR